MIGGHPKFGTILKVPGTKKVGNHGSEIFTDNLNVRELGILLHLNGKYEVQGKNKVLGYHHLSLTFSMPVLPLGEPRTHSCRKAQSHIPKKWG